MGKGVKVDWQESSEELKQLYQKEVHPQRRTRLQAFWQLSQGKRIQDVVDTTGASYRSMEQWLRWYRRGRLGEVLRRVVGHQAKGKKPYLNPLQQRALVAGATGPVPDGLGCKGVGLGTLGGALYL